MNKLVETEYEDREKAEAAAIAAKGLAKLERAADGKYVVKTLASNRPARCRRSSTRRSSPIWSISSTTWPSPRATSASTIGIAVLIFLGVLFAFAYALKRNYWKDIH